MRYGPILLSCNVVAGRRGDLKDCKRLYQDEPSQVLMVSYLFKDRKNNTKHNYHTTENPSTKTQTVFSCSCAKEGSIDSPGLVVILLSSCPWVK